uniref:valine--tRNA ligase n=1 Tax=Anas zonorhyncha TaxID=75864 RepID=A0A8B9V5I3_9AVES
CPQPPSHGGAILEQLRALGASLDWSRCAFTMDPGFSRAVTEAFVRLHGAGLVRRSRRLVNWSCALRSALADVEVEPRVLGGPTVLSGPGWPRAVTFGVLVRFAYPVEGDDGEEGSPVSPRGPQCHLGGPNHLHGRHVRHPFTGRLLPVIADPSVDPELGTGAVKVTPGHGHPDLALARAHRLPPPRGGAHRFDARERLVAALAMRGLFRGCQDHPMTLPLCSRSGDVVEFLLKSQWFLRCREMAQRAREAVTSGSLKLVPKFHEKNWKTWMDNAGDPKSPKMTPNPPQTPDFRRFYPTSLLETGSDLLFFWVARMVMLGQELTGRLPFSQVLLHSLVRDAQGRKMSKSLGNVIDPRDVIAGASLQELQEKLRRSNLDPHELAVASEGQRRQFPHGIPECGTDALRMALCSHNAHGDDIRLDVATVLSYRHFCNKVWNAVKFVLAALGPDFVPQTPEEAAPRRPMERWVLSRLARAAGEYGRRMEALEAHGALAAAHHFWLRSFCDVYLVGWGLRPSVRLSGHPGVTLLSCAELGLRLLAPFAPFLAEELWQRLPRASPASPTICLAPFPDAAMLAHWCCPEVEAEVEAMREVVRVVRALRETFRLGAARPHGECRQGSRWPPGRGTGGGCWGRDLGGVEGVEAQDGH